MIATQHNIVAPEAADATMQQQQFDDSVSINKLKFTDEVQVAIEQVLQSTDPLDSPDFNSIDYINQLFPTEQSLSNIDDVIGRMQLEIGDIDENIRCVVRGQSTTGQDGRGALDEARKVILQLFGQITEIKTRAEKTEEMVREITRDIKQLDCAKRNLTSAITTLNHLHMLVGGVESLTKLAEKRQYGELLNPLQAITEVNQHFQQYTDIVQIKELSNKVEQIHRELAKQITEDFHTTFLGGSQQAQKMSLAQLTDACAVVSVLDSRVKRDLLKWFINLQLQEYQQLFHENQDIAWLDKIDKRYAWLKRHLLDFEDKYGKIFPLEWDVSERITVQFCHVTHDELAKIMQKRRTEIDVKLLLFAITKTTSFETLLAKRFTGQTFAAATTTVVVAADEQSGEQPQQQASAFIDLIGKCFKSYLDIYIDSIDRNLCDIIERFCQDVKQQPPFDPVANNSTVFPSCADLFVFYKKCMVQCNQLSTGRPMLDLTMIFKKYLREYASKILEYKIPKISTAQTSIGTSMSLLTKDLQNLSTAAGHVIHSLLKEGEALRYTKDELIRICCILTTAEYCLETVQQLEDKLKEKIDPELADKIDLSDETDIFHRIISNCIHLMVQDMESGCEPALIVMSKIQWQHISNVGDQSAFVNSMISHFKHTIPIIRDNLSASRKYYTQFCHKFVNSLIPRYITTLYKCRQDGATTNVMGCEQLLLDTHSIKTILLDLPSIGSAVNRKAPASYTKVVVKGMTKAEMIIKIVMAPIVPAAAFVEQYLKLLPDSSLSEYHKILDMKGLRRVDQAHLIELFKRNAPKDMIGLDTTATTPSTALSDAIDSPARTPTSAGGGGGTAAGGLDKGHIKKLEKLIKKRLP